MSEHPSTPEVPRITVVIPCFNDGELALAAVASVQEDEPVQIVVVDDASTDADSKRALEPLGAAGHARLIEHNRNRGLSQTRMTGVEATSSRFVFPLDADDLAVPHALSMMADLLDGERSAAVCFGDYLEFGDRELVRAVPARLDPYRVAYTNEYPPSAMFRRSALLRAGGWQLRDYGYEDWDLWMTLAENGERAVYPGPGVLTYRRRLHGRRMLHTSKRHHVQLYRTLRERHPRLFAEIDLHRRRSDMPLRRKLLYPVVYGPRPRYGFEQWVKALLDRVGIWTLRR